MNAIVIYKNLNDEIKFKEETLETTFAFLPYLITDGYHDTYGGAIANIVKHDITLDGKTVYIDDRILT
jgi:hypothetical protein